MARLGWAVAVMLVGCGAGQGMPEQSTGTGSDGGEPWFDLLVADPPELTFGCDGCGSAVTTLVMSQTTRQLRVINVEVRPPDEHVSVGSIPELPITLDGEEGFELMVTVDSPALPAPGAEVAISYAVGETGALREIVIPLVGNDAQGAPLLSVSPNALHFGYVPLGKRTSIAFRVRNVGGGSSPLRVDGFDAGGLSVGVEFPQPNTLLPGEERVGQLVWEPRTEQYLRGEVQIVSSTPGIAPFVVAVDGTSIGSPRVLMQPARVDFGTVAVGGTAQHFVEMTNVGGVPIELSEIGSGNQLVSVTLADGALAPMASTTMTVTVDTANPGEVDAGVVAKANGAALATFLLPVTATVAQTSLHAAAVDFGTVASGWVTKKSAIVSNFGLTQVEIVGADFAQGSSRTFAFTEALELPFMLAPGQQMHAKVEFRAETIASFEGALLLATRDVQVPVLRIPLYAKVSACSQTCRYANAAATCSGGRCGLGACTAGYYNTNGASGDGCECRALGGGPKVFCADATDLGEFADDGSARVIDGNLPSSGTDTWFRFHASDVAQFGPDDYHVRVALTSTDSTLNMCVYRYPSEVHVDECRMVNEDCGRDFERPGTTFFEDGAEYFIKVSRTPGAKATCTGFSIRLSNGSE